MKNIKRIILILIIVSLLTSCTTSENQSNISEAIQAESAILENTVDNQNNHDLSSSSENSLDNREVISVSADELIKEFSENEILAMEKYKGKTVTISGIIFGKGRPKDFIPETDASYVIFGDYEKMIGACNAILIKLK